jgi:putative membrane protein
MKRAIFAGMALALASTVFAQARDKTPRITQSGSADIEFIFKAAQGGMAEVELGKVAAEQGTSDEVRKFGQRMADDHGRGGEELKAIAQSRGITLPAELDPKEKAMRDRLAKLRGSTFDRTYMRAMLSDHRQDVAEFKRESTSGRDPEVKAWAMKALPMLEDHLRQAEAANRTGATK